MNICGAGAKCCAGQEHKHHNKEEREKHVKSNHIRYKSDNIVHDKNLPKHKTFGIHI
jgi:hypothetical protein